MKMLILLTNAVKKCMEQQWSTVVKPGRAKVKVKVKEELASAVVVNPYSTAK